MRIVRGEPCAGIPPPYELVASSSLIADAIDFFLDRQSLKAGERQVKEQANSAFENQVRITKSMFDLLRRTFNHRGIGNAPVCGHRLPGPDGTHFLGRVVANGEDNSSSALRAWRT